MNRPYLYRITVEGRLDPGWSDWFCDLSIQVIDQKDGSCQTILTGPVPDQSALRGVLNKIWDLNLDLIAVIPLKSEVDDDNANHSLL